jgi:hypothetical protein
VRAADERAVASFLSATLVIWFLVEARRPAILADGVQTVIDGVLLGLVQSRVMTRRDSSSQVIH